MQKLEDEKKQLWILLPNMEELHNARAQLDAILKEHPGSSGVFIQLKEEKKGLASRSRVHVDDSLLSKLKLALLGVIGNPPSISPSIRKVTTVS
jgi:hypothetical protein